MLASDGSKQRVTIRVNSSRESGGVDFIVWGPWARVSCASLKCDKSIRGVATRIKQILHDEWFYQICSI